MKLIWRYYHGNHIINEGTVNAPCRVTAKRKVTKAIKKAQVVPIDYKSRWSEKQHHTITPVDNLRGKRFPMSTSTKFIVFFYPENEQKMINEMTHPKDMEKSKQIELF